MHNEHLFYNAFIFLCAAVVAVPLAKKFGLSSVLGYLVAGIVIGPFGFGLVGKEGEDVMHFAEFGVVMMLFLVGLELAPRLLWKLRGPIIGLGGLQVILTTALITVAVFFLFEFSWQISLAIGLTLALSSTAIVLQSLNEKGLMKSEGGQSSFAVLLFQDIAVIPILAAFPLLATLSSTGGEKQHGHGEGSAFQQWVDHLPAIGRSLLVLAAIVAIILIGRFVLRHLLRAIAKTGLRETFTMFSLLLVIGIALLMNSLGVSPALGAFVAGVVLATSEYRHELESDIEPFKGILLSVFFIAVGAGIDFSLIGANPLLIAGLVIGLIVVKLGVLLLLGWVFKLSIDQRFLFAFGLCQAGEFGFVLVGFGSANGVFGPETGQFMIAVIALTMALTPLVMLFEEKILRPRFGCREDTIRDREADTIDEENQVILAGFGRFGNYVGRFLRSQRIGVTVIEHDSDHVEFLRKIGIKAYYGDASRRDLLESAGAAEAKLLIITFREPGTTMKLVETARRHFPNLTILARAHDRAHWYDLICNDVWSIHEQGHSAVFLARHALVELGIDREPAANASHKFLEHDFENATHLAKVSQENDEDKYLSHVKQSVQKLEQLFEEEQLHDPDRDGDSAG